MIDAPDQVKCKCGQWTPRADGMCYPCKLKADMEATNVTAEPVKRAARGAEIPGYCLEGPIGPIPGENDVDYARRKQRIYTRRNRERKNAAADAFRAQAPRQPTPTPAPAPKPVHHVKPTVVDCSLDTAFASVERAEVDAVQAWLRGDDAPRLLQMVRNQMPEVLLLAFAAGWQASGK